MAEQKDPVNASIVSDDGKFQIDTTGWTWKPSSGGSVSVKTEDGKTIASMTVPEIIAIGTKDNHINFGGGDMTVEGHSGVERCSVTGDIIGGSFKLGHGVTESFQIKCKVDSPVDGLPRFTASAENTIEKEAKVGLPQNVKLQPPEEKLVQSKDPLFDIAGIYLPGSRFVGWQKQLNLTLKIAGDASKKTITATLKLVVDMRPLFQPPEPKEPISPDPTLDDLYKKFKDAGNRVGTWQAIMYTLDHQLKMLMDVKHKQEIEKRVKELIEIVATATAAFTAAAAIAAAFLEMNPVADAAEAAAEATVLTESAELAATKAAQVAAEKAIQVTFEKMTGQMVKDEIFSALAKAIEDAGKDVLLGVTKQKLKHAVEEEFKSLVQKYGLEKVNANENLNEMKRVLTAMRDAADGTLKEAQAEQHAAHKAYDERAEKRRRSIILYKLIGSWQVDVSHLRFLTFTDCNLRRADDQKDAEVKDVVGDLNDTTVRAKQMDLMWKTAKKKGYTGFVVIPERKKAYFRNAPVGDLFNTLETGDYCKGWFSYVKPENLSLQMIGQHWDKSSVW